MSSQAERDAAYNNSAAVGDSAGLMAAMTAASAELTPDLVIPYGAGQRNGIDLFAGGAGKPCLVFLHGGYWQRNQREMFWVLAAGVRAHGWSVAFPGYTLAPQASLLQIGSEIHSGLDVIAQKVSGPLIVSGWSAGGHLTAMAMTHPSIAAGLAISGVFDLAPIRDTYLNEKLSLTDGEIETLSPLRLPVVPKPLALAYGTAELPALVADSRALHALRAAAHAPGALVPVAGANHFTILDALRAPEGAITRQLLAL